MWRWTLSLTFSFPPPLPQLRRSAIVLKWARKLKYFWLSYYTIADQCLIVKLHASDSIIELTRSFLLLHLLHRLNHRSQRLVARHGSACAMITKRRRRTLLHSIVPPDHVTTELLILDSAGYVDWVWDWTGRKTSLLAWHVMNPWYITLHCSYRRLQYE